MSDIIIFAAHVAKVETLADIVRYVQKSMVNLFHYNKLDNERI